MLAALCLLGCCAVLAAEKAEEENAYVGIATRWASEAEKQSLGADEGARVLYVMFPGALVPVAIAEGDLPKEGGQDIYTGIRCVFAEPLPAERDGFYLEIQASPDELLRPVRVEYAGEIRYGLIEELGDDYMVQALMSDRDTKVRSVITPDTVGWYEAEPFAVGSGCEAVVDEDGNVLVMIESNG